MHIKMWLKARTHKHPFNRNSEIKKKFFFKSINIFKSRLDTVEERIGKLKKWWIENIYIEANTWVKNIEKYERDIWDIIKA